MHLSRRGGTALAAAVLVLSFWGTGRANAAPIMTLTQAGIDQGFQLSTFATGFPSIPGETGNPDYGIGPLGISFTAGGGVLVSDGPGFVRGFPNLNPNQVAGAPWAAYNTSNAVGMAQVGNSIYMAQQTNSRVVQIDSSGIVQQVVASNLAHPTGIIVNPANNHLLVSTGGASPNQIFDVNPVTHTSTFLFNAAGDGMTLSADGKTLYTATGDRVVGYNLATGAQVFDSGSIPGSDGTVMGSGVLAGYLFVNTHDGTLVEVNMATLVQTTIAAGGSRGDFVTIAPDGTLLITQSDRVLELKAPSGGGFGGPGVPGGVPFATSVPEPSALALFGLGAAALAGWRWRRGRRRAP